MDGNTKERREEWGGTEKGRVLVPEESPEQEEDNKEMQRSGEMLIMETNTDWRLFFYDDLENGEWQLSDANQNEIVLDEEDGGEEPANDHNFCWRNHPHAGKGTSSDEKIKGNR